MLEFRAVSKALDGTPVLFDIDFDVADGQTRALIGSSGAGKTTVIRLALGLIEPDRGSIRIAGREPSAIGRVPWTRQIGYVPQQGGLFPHFSVHDNITLLARDQGWGRARIEERLKAVVDLVGLAPELLARFPHELSGGQLQRAAIMRALLLDPPLMLLDEPLGALDPIVRSALQTELRALFKRLGKTVLLVTHDLAEAAFLAEQISLLHQGCILQSGSYAELSRHPASDYVSLFLSAQRTLPVAASPS
jgi:osmoprotectant transport system ATP-binding protein